MTLVLTIFGMKRWFIVFAGLLIVLVVFVEKHWRPIRSVMVALEFTASCDELIRAPLCERMISGGWLDPLMSRAVVAHAGGALDGHKSTNSIDALLYNYNLGCRIFEVDLLFTSDDVLVLAHDWHQYSQITGIETGQPISGDFKSTLIHSRYKSTTWSDVEGFLESHKDALVISDTKGDNLLVLNRLSTSSCRGQVIVQTYRPREIVFAQGKGFFGIILTLYRYPHWNWVVEDIARRTQCGITMPLGVATPAFCKQLQILGSPVFVHPVDSVGDVDGLGQVGVYTSFIDKFIGSAVPKK